MSDLVAEFFGGPYDNELRELQEASYELVVTRPHPDSLPLWRESTEELNTLTMDPGRYQRRGWWENGMTTVVTYYWVGWDSSREIPS